MKSGVGPHLEKKSYNLSNNSSISLSNYVFRIIYYYRCSNYDITLYSNIRISHNLLFCLAFVYVMFCLVNVYCDII